MLPRTCRTVFIRAAYFFFLQYRFFCWEFIAHEEEEHVKLMCPVHKHWRALGYDNVCIYEKILPYPGTQRLGKRGRKTTVLFYYYYYSKRSYNTLSTASTHSWRLDLWCWCTCGWQCCYWLQRVKAKAWAGIDCCSFYPRKGSLQHFAGWGDLKLNITVL